MPELDISGATAAGNTQEDFSVQSQTTNAAGESEETEWISTTWNENLGYYKSIPELKVAIDTKATWIIGAGIETEPETELLLLTIKGNGKDSFTSILKNQIKVCMIDGDSFAEIIRDDDGNLINLKPLAPDRIKSFQNRQGRFTKYEFLTPQKKFLGLIKRKAKRLKLDVEEIFHLSRERIADEMHGISVIDSVKEIILARNEAMSDWRRVMHRNIEPLMIFHLDEDDPTKVAEIKNKYNNARKEGENLFVPKNIVEPEIVGVAPNATLSPLEWIDRLNDYFYQAVNVRQIIIGSAKDFTDASGKTVDVAYEQSVKAGQLYIEEQVLGQLNIEINLTFPASLQNDTISNTPTETQTIEEEPIEEPAQPNDTTEELEGKT